MGTPSNALAIRNQDVQALVGSKFYQPCQNGIQFQTDKEGKLADIPKADIDALVGSIVKFQQADNWWVGDTGNVILTLWGEDAFNDFCEKINKDPKLVRKYTYVSNSYGWPDKITQMRHPDTEHVSFRHHELAQGVKDRKQRMRLLDAAAKAKESAADFYERIKNLDGKGKGDASEGGGVTERGVFKVVAGIWDDKVESAEQFIQKAIDKLKSEFQYYADPNLAKQREQNEAKERALKGLDAEIAATLRTEGAEMDVDAFKKHVADAKTKAKTATQIKTYVEKQIAIGEKLSDETKATLQAKRDQIIKDAADLDAAKKAVTAYRAEIKTAEKNVTDNEKLAAKIKDEAKRKELLDVAAEQSLTPAQFAPMVQAVLTDELLAAEKERIDKKTANMVGLGEKKATGVDSSKLAHPKGGKKKGAKKR